MAVPPESVYKSHNDAYKPLARFSAPGWTLQRCGPVFGLFCLVYSEAVKTSFCVLLACVSITMWAQTPSTRLPWFEDYLVTEIFRGTPADPKIVTPIDRKYRTRIREAAGKGWGVYRDGKEQHHPGPKFAGNMILAQWGCGAPCLMIAVVDAESGDVYLPPLVVAKTFALPMLCVGNAVSSNPKITFRQNSRLMVIEATPDCSQMKHHSYAHYFLWNGDHWTTLYRERLD